MFCTISDTRSFSIAAVTSAGLEHDYSVHRKLVHMKRQMWTCIHVHERFPIKINIGSPVIKSEYQNSLKARFCNPKQQDCSQGAMKQLGASLVLINAIGLRAEIKLGIGVSIKNVYCQVLIYHFSSSVDLKKKENNNNNKNIRTFFRDEESHLADVFITEILLPFFTPILFRVLRVLIKPDRSTSLGK